MLTWTNKLKSPCVWYFTFGFDFDANKAIKAAKEPRLKTVWEHSEIPLFAERNKDANEYGYYYKTPDVKTAQRVNKFKERISLERVKFD